MKVRTNYFSSVAVLCVIGVFSLLVPIFATANEGSSESFACRYFSLILKPFGGCAEQIDIVTTTVVPKNTAPIQTPFVAEPIISGGLVVTENDTTTSTSIVTAPTIFTTAPAITNNYITYSIPIISNATDSNKNKYISSDLFYKQIDKVYDSVDSRLDEINDENDIFNSFETKQLVVTENADVAGSLEVGGSLYLNNFTPTSTTNRLYAQAGALYWNGALVGGGGAANLSDLLDVAIVAPAVGNLLMFDGSDWVNVATSSLGISAGSGTVTSVEASVPTGFTITGSPITNSGVLAIGYAAGYEGLRTASSSAWNTFYNSPSNRITAGTGLGWIGNTLSVQDNYLLNTGDSISGNLSFSGSAANIALGSNYLSGDGGDEGIYISNNGYASIGTNLELAPLAVHSGAASTSMVLVNNLSDARIIFANSTFSNFAGIGMHNNGLSLTGGGDTSLSSHLFINDSGNVGFGTTSPLTKIDVVNTGNSASILARRTDGRSVRLSAASGESSIVYDSAGPFTIRGATRSSVDGNNTTVGTVHAYFSTTGNFGLGTTTPDQELTVVGNANITGNIMSATWNGTTIGTTYGGTGLTSYATGDLIYASGANTLAARAVGSTGDVLLVVGGVPTWVATSSLGISGGSAFGSFIDVGELAVSDFGSFSCDGFECTIDSGAVDISAHTNLSVGVLGLALAGDEITLSAGYEIPLTASTTNWNTAYSWGNHASSGYASSSALSNYLPLTGGTLSGNLSMSGTSANIALGSNWLSGDGGDEGIYVDGSGNVGIGTSTPISKLDIYSYDASPASDLLTMTNNHPDGKSVFKVNGDNEFIAFGLYNSNFLVPDLRNVGGFGASGAVLVTSNTDVPNGGSDPIRFSAGGYSNEKMRLTAAGNLGIGTTTPSSTLTVAGTMAVSSLTSGRIPYATTGGQLIDNANFGYNGSNLILGSSGIQMSDVFMARGAANRLDLATGDSINLISGNYQIGGTNVLTSSALGSGITSSSLTSLGTLTSLAVSGASTLATTTATALTTTGAFVAPSISANATFGVTLTNALNMAFNDINNVGDLIVNSGVLTVSGTSTLATTTVSGQFNAPAFSSNVLGGVTFTDNINMSFNSLNNVGNINIVSGSLSNLGTSTLATTSLTAALLDRTGSAGTAGYILQTTGSGTQWVATSSLGISGGASFTDSASLAALLSDETGTGLAVFNASPTFTGTAIFANSSTTNATTTNLAVTSLTSGRVPYLTTGGRLIDNTNFTFNGSNLTLGSTTGGIQFGADVLLSRGAANRLDLATGDSLNLVSGSIAFNASTTITASTTNDSYTFGELAGATFTASNIYNVAIGYQAGRYASSSGSNNLFFGRNSGQFFAGGSNNTLIGSFSGSQSTGDYNILIGSSGVGNRVNGSRNIIMGDEAVVTPANLNANIIMGYFAGYTLATGTENIAFGRSAMGNALQGSQNIALGSASLRLNNGTGTIGIGFEVAQNATAVDRGIFIGFDVSAASTTQDDVLNIGNLIFGNGVDGIGTTLSSGNIGIGTSTPTSKLTVAGDTNQTGALRFNDNAGTAGQVLLSNGASAPTWVATSTLGFGFSFTDSASLAALLSDETGSAGGGLAVFSNAPTFTGTAIFANLIATNATTTNLAISSLTSGRVPYLTTGGRLIDNANLTFNGTSLTFGTDAALSRGAANRLDLATGDSLNLVLGGIAFNGTNMITGSTTNDSYTFGELAGASFNTNTINNVAIGTEAAQYASTTNVDYNNFIGYRSGRNNTGMNNNVIGMYAGQNNTGSYNNLFGLYTGHDNTGSNNNMLSNHAGVNNTGSFNNMFGIFAGRNNSGSYSEFIGYEAAARMSASSTVAIGGLALRGGSGSAISGNAATTTNNVAIGYGAGYNVLTGGNNNLLLGYQAADSLTTGANNIIIGYDVEAPSNTGSNQLNIGNLIFGTGIDGAGTTLSSGNIGIGTSSPSSKLDVWGSMRVGTSSSPLLLADTDANQVLLGTATPFTLSATASTSLLVQDTAITFANSLEPSRYGQIMTNNLGYLNIQGTTIVDIGLPGTSALGRQIRVSINGVSVNSNKGDLDFRVLGTTDDQLIFADASSDNVGIGTTTPVSKLSVDGTIFASNLLGGTTPLEVDANGNIIRGVSDARLKTNVTDIENALDTLLALRGVRYEWLDPQRFGSQAEIGFLAQEVDMVVPEVVSKGGEYWSLNTKNLVAVVVEAVKEIWDKVQQQDERLNALEAENAALHNRLLQLESGNNGGGDVPNDTPEDETPPVNDENETPTTDSEDTAIEPDEIPDIEPEATETTEQTPDEVTVPDEASSPETE